MPWYNTVLSFAAQGGLYFLYGIIIAPSKIFVKEKLINQMGNHGEGEVFLGGKWTGERLFFENILHAFLEFEAVFQRSHTKLCFLGIWYDDRNKKIAAFIPKPAIW